jgi:hypothetical protein
MQDLLSAIQAVVRRDRYLVTEHAARQAEKRHIAVHELKEALLSDEAEVIEDYLEDRRGSSCLVLGVTEGGRILHVQVSYPTRVWIITVYEPGEDKRLDPRTRR